MKKILTFLFCFLPFSALGTHLDEEKEVLEILLQDNTYENKGAERCVSLVGSALKKHKVGSESGTKITETYYKHYRDDIVFITVADDVHTVFLIFYISENRLELDHQGWRTSIMENITACERIW